MSTFVANFGTHLSICQGVNTHLSTIGNRLKEERLRLGLSQEELGRIGGVRKQAQLNYEKGERSPDTNYLSLVTIDGGVDLLYVITGVRRETSETGISPTEAELLESFRRLGSEDQRAVIRHVKALAVADS